MPKIRLECYERIRNEMKRRILAYYGVNKEYLGDLRSQAAIKESMDGLEHIFRILDDYEIRSKSSVKDESATKS